MEGCCVEGEGDVWRVRVMCRGEGNVWRDEGDWEGDVWRG